MRVVITGANRGIGLGLARAYAARGEIVHAAARKVPEWSALGEVASASEGRLLIHEVDVTHEADATRLASDIGGQPVDLLINNAGVGSKFARLTEIDFAELIRSFDVNAVGPLRVTRALLPLLKAAHGKVVNISSTVGSIAENRTGRNYPYRLSKAALNMATRSLAVDFAPENISVYSVHPGWVQTDMGGPKATTPIEAAVGEMIALFDRLGPADSGKFFGPDGKEIPW